MTTYILHVSLLLGLGFILYQLLLRKETFYSLNRVILSSYILLAFALPLIHIPSSWSLQKLEPIASNLKDNRKKAIVPIQSTPIQSSIETQPNVDKNAILNNVENKSLIQNELSSAQESSNTIVPSVKETLQKTGSSINWISAVKWSYLIGLGIFLINFIVQFSILLFYRIKYPTLKDGKLTIVEMEGDKAPFSFLNMIYINPSKYDYDTYEQILAHEKIHINKWHSFDIFLSEIALIILWFNPFAWLYRKAVEHNLEYLTDQEMLASGANAEVYQMNLLKVSVPELPLSLSTNYNQSFLKKRIHMMNAKKSSASSTWKYLFILPILGLTVTLFNPTFISGQNTGNENNQEELINLSKDDVNEKPYQPKSKLELQFASQDNQEETPELNIEFPDANTKSEPITLKDIKESDIEFHGTVEVDKSSISDLAMFNFEENEDLLMSQIDNGYSISSSKGRTFHIDTQEGKTTVKSATENLENDGAWEGKLKDDEVCLSIKKVVKGDNYYWNSGECFRSSAFTPTITNNAKGPFSLTRAPGTLVLNGDFTNGKGTGKYTFTPNKQFIATALSNGYTISEDKLIHFFLSGIDASFFSFLKSNGYTKIDEEDILAMAIHNVNEEYIIDINREFKQANYRQPNVEELIALKIHDVDMEYIKSFGKELYEDLEAEQIIAAAINDVDPKYISEFKALGYKDLTFDNLIAAAIHDVDIDYVKKLKGAGFKDLTFDNLIAAAIHDLDPEYIKEFKAAGFNDLTFDNLIAAGIHDVDVTYLKKAKEYGFDLTFDQLIGASIHDVDLEYIEAFSKSGLKNLTFDNMIAASIHDVDPQFIKDFNALGYTDLTFDNLIAASIHDVDIEFIKAFKASGFTDWTFDNFIAASIHDIEPSYVKELKALNIKNISFDDIIAFGIHDVEIEDIKEFRTLGFDLSADKYIEASIHDLTPDDVKKMQAKGHKDLKFNEYIRLKIHGF